MSHKGKVVQGLIPNFMIDGWYKVEGDRYEIISLEDGRATVRATIQLRDSHGPKRDMIGTITSNDSREWRKLQSALDLS